MIDDFDIEPVIDEEEVVEVPVEEVEENPTNAEILSIEKKLKKYSDLFKRLTAAEEVELTLKWQNHKDQAARKRLYDCNIRLVITYAKKWRNKGLDLEDLIQEASISLLHAIDKFDPTKGFRFSTYAVWWLRQGTSRAVINTGKSIRIPIHQQSEMSRIQKIYSQFMEKHKRKPDKYELAKESGMPLEKVEQLGRNMRDVMSLDDPIGDEDGMTRINLEQSHFSIEPQEQIESQLDLQKVHELINRLPEKDKELLLFSVGYYDGRDKDEQDLLEYANLDKKEAQRRIRRIVSKLRNMANYKDFNIQFISNVVVQSFGTDLNALRSILSGNCQMVNKKSKISYKLSDAQIDCILKDGTPAKIAQLPTADAEELAEELRAIGCKVSLIRT